MSRTFEASRWLGPLLARARLHAVDINATAVVKRRRWFAPWLIAPGNLYLRWLGAGARVLPARTWLAWERAVNLRLYAIECEVDPRGALIMPRWPGVVLAGYAAGPRGDRPRALAAAARALADLHAVEMPLLDGVTGRLSHGDANLRNVLYDPSTGAARWFDFDTVHDPSLPAADRHADDLRALLYSALEACADLPVAAVFEAVRSGHDDPAPWAHLRDRLARGPIHAGPFHLAQARPTIGRCREVERLMTGSAGVPFDFGIE